MITNSDHNLFHAFRPCAQAGAIFLLCVASPAIAQPENQPDFFRLMNLGKAHLENRDAKKAAQAFDDAIKINRKSAPAFRNLARARLMAGDHKMVLPPLGWAEKLDPQSPATYYLRGLAYKHRSLFNQATVALEQAVRLDPRSATVRYQLAGVYESNLQHDLAYKQLKKAIDLDPLNASVHFKMATHARRNHLRDQFQKHMKEFIRLKKLFPDHTRSVNALEKCFYTMPESPTSDDVRPAVKMESAIDVTFTDVTEQVFAAPPDRIATAVTVLDQDAQGKYTLIVIGPHGGFARLKMSAEGQFERETMDISLEGETVFEQILVGNVYDDVPAGEKYDFNQHAKNDVIVNGKKGLRLLKRTGEKSFQDITESAGLDKIKSPFVQWIDYEHDGDLDLLVSQSSGLQLWQNNGDATFQNVTEEASLKGVGLANDCIACDLDQNVAVDIVVMRDQNTTVVYENQRIGKFSKMTEPPGPWPIANHMLAGDLTDDGYPEIILITDGQIIILENKTFRQTRINLPNIEVSAAILFDFDNDARLDIALVGKNKEYPAQGAVRIFRGTPSKSMSADQWIDVSEKMGLTLLSLPTLQDVIAADFDTDGDSDLLLVSDANMLHLLSNNGGHAHGQLKIRLSTVKTNPSGYGTHIELRDRLFFTSRTVSQTPIEIGLRSRRQFDSIQTVWTNGVVDNQIAALLKTEKPITIVEKNVATGSCPFLYAWDGKRFRFVTDILGNAPVGLPLSRDRILPADPDELVMIGDAQSFPPLHGYYTVKVTSEFLEVLYLDNAKLLAVDHPEHIEIHSTDKLMPAPFPPSQLWALRDTQPLRIAMGDDGIDRSDALLTIDNKFAPMGSPLPPPFRGMCNPLTITLDFGSLDTQKSLVLALTGWLNYGQASSNIALSQSSSHNIIPPKIEVETMAGQWLPVDVVVGMPAGKTKTILCDLAGKLPPQAKRLRLINTFEIHWDRIRLMERIELPREVSYELLPARADLQWRGFSEMKSHGPDYPVTPDFDVVSNFPSWRGALEGFCTRYGDVLELVATRDDRLALVNAGDVVTLQFPADKLPPIPQGMRRTFYFYSFGWEKDGDHNVVNGNQVSPLPNEDPNLSTIHIIDENDWRIQYNTRWVPRDKFAPEK